MSKQKIETIRLPDQVKDFYTKVSKLSGAKPETVMRVILAMHAASYQPASKIEWPDYSGGL